MGNQSLLINFLEARTQIRQVKMAKFLYAIGLCILFALALAEAHLSKKDLKTKFDKKDDELKCTTVLDDVTHEVCRTEYHDECTDKSVDDRSSFSVPDCLPATEK